MCGARGAREGGAARAFVAARRAPAPPHTVGFHAQQCAEKYLKALLCFRGQDIPRTHDVEWLLSRTDMWDRLEMAVEDTRLLTDYATVTRFPKDYEPVTPAEAAHAIEMAAAIRTVVRSELPSKVP